MIGPLNGCPKRLSYGVFPSDNRSVNVSEIGITFHCFCPPMFIQTWLRQYCRGTFFNSAHCSFSNTISLRSVWCGRIMIPGKIFTSFAKFQGSVSVDDFRLPIWLQDFLHAFLCFWRSFLVLHGYDWIHWVAKSCTTIAYWWLFLDSEHPLRTLWSALLDWPKFSARGTAPPLRPLHGPL